MAKIKFQEESYATYAGLGNIGLGKPKPATAPTRNRTRREEAMVAKATAARTAASNYAVDPTDDNKFALFGATAALLAAIEKVEV